MKRPLSLVLAAAFAASTFAMSVAPAAAEGVGITIGTGNWDNDGWHDDGWRHHRRHHVAPGFSFSFGVPYAHTYSYYHPRRDRVCHRAWNGDLVCRYRY